MNSRTPIRFGVSVLALAALLPLTPSTGLAGPRIYNAMGCRRDGANTHCFIERTNVSNTNGLRGFEVRLSGVVLGHSIICILKSMGTDGSQVLSLQQRRTTGQSGLVTLKWDANLSRSVNNGTYEFNCQNMNPESSLISYKATEY